MLAVIITVCLRTDPVHCSDRILAWTSGVTESVCKTENEFRIADFTQKNPDFVVKAYACMPGRR